MASGSFTSAASPASLRQNSSTSGCPFNAASWRMFFPSYRAINEKDIRVGAFWYDTAVLSVSGWSMCLSRTRRASIWPFAAAPWIGSHPFTSCSVWRDFTFSGFMVRTISSTESASPRTAALKSDSSLKVQKTSTYPG